MERKYYSGITLFKLLGALTVVAFHVLFYRYMDVMEREGFEFASLLLKVVVPCFYAAAGFLAYRGWTHAGEPAQYVKRYVRRILLFYGIFCLIYIPETMVPALLSGGITPGSLLFQLKLYVMAVLVHGPYMQLWFIPPLAAGVLLSYWADRRLSLRGVIALTLGGFLLSQLGSGTLRAVAAAAAGSEAIFAWKPIAYANLFVTNYIGFGFTFVMAGVLIAKHEALFRTHLFRPLLAFAIVLTAAEWLFLERTAQWHIGYKLALSLLPNTLLLFWGILRIRLDGMRRHHRLINLFTLVTFCCHILFLKLNLLLLGRDAEGLTIPEGLLVTALTLVQCAAAAYGIAAWSRRRSGGAPGGARQRGVFGGEAGR